jgi:hypothetical protein
MAFIVSGGVTALPGLGEARRTTGAVRTIK